MGDSKIKFIFQIFSSSSSFWHQCFPIFIKQIVKVKQLKSESEVAKELFDFIFSQIFIKTSM